jgi:hypothetical protein
MKAYALKFAATALVIAGLFATIQLIGERQAENTAAISSLGDVRSLLSTYDRWKDNKARGQAFLDLVGGTISVEVSGFPEEQALDVWLIDNRPGPGRSVKPEPGDAMVRLGRLKHEGWTAALEARLGREAITGFEIDLVVVARAGEDPGKASLLFGSPTLFQRLYQASSSVHRRSFNGSTTANFESSLPDVARLVRRAVPTRRTRASCLPHSAS